MDTGARVRTEEQHNAARGASDSRTAQGGDDVMSSNIQRDECRVRKPRRSQRTTVPLRRRAAQFTTTAACALLASRVPSAMAQESCISLTGSTACPAFNASSISTNSNLTGLFPFLADVTDTDSFDSEIQNYVSGNYAQTKYVVVRYLRICINMLTFASDTSNY
jgi:hypothetical protein